MRRERATTGGPELHAISLPRQTATAGCCVGGMAMENTGTGAEEIHQ